MWCCRRILKISRVDRVTNEKGLLISIVEERSHHKVLKIRIAKQPVRKNVTLKRKENKTIDTKGIRTERKNSRGRPYFKYWGGGGTVCGTCNKLKGTSEQREKWKNICCEPAPALLTWKKRRFVVGLSNELTVGPCRCDNVTRNDKNVVLTATWRLVGLVLRAHTFHRRIAFNNCT